MWESSLVEHKFAENGRQHLLRLVNDEHGPRQGGIDVGLPTLAQDFCAGPAIVRAQLDPEQLTHLAIEVGKIGLGPAAHPDLDVTLRAEPVGEHAQGDRLSGTGRAGEECKAALAGKLLDAPAEGLDAGRGMERLSRHVGAKRIPLQTKE
jgi:hypothetical protein